MFLSDASVRRPIAMASLIIGLTLLGANAFRKLGLELMPKMDAPFVTVTTIYPGASPEQIEVDVAKRIEDQVVSIDGLKHVSSSCMENVCQTFLEFNMDVDVDIAATDVREKIDLIRADFPEDVEDPKILKFDINATPVVQMAFTGDVPLDELYDYADNTLRDRITVISGVANVELIGGAKREVHVKLDRAQLAARGLSSLDVLRTVQAGVRKIPSGRVRESGTEYTVEFDADYDVARDIGSLEVINEDGRRCYIRDVAAVEMATEELRQKATIDGKPAIAIKVVKKADANAVRVVNRVKKAMKKLNASLPGGMELVWVADDGRFIEASVNSAWGNVGQGIALTAAVLFLFLYNIRATVVVAITMPLTILIGLFFMQFAGYTLNTSTLIAIGLSVGILVTNSIVVLEAIVKRLDETGDAKQASRLGASEATIAVLASAGTNVVVLFPIAMMGGKIAMFMRPLALTMLIMTVVSLFISFTLTPLLCSIMLKPREEGSRSPLARMERGWNWMFDRVVGGYRRVLQFNERRRIAAVFVLLVTAGLFVHSMSLAKAVGFGFFAQPDKGQLFVKMEFPTRYDLARTSKRVLEVEDRLKGLPELRHILSTIGKVEGMLGKSSEGVYLAQVLLRFSERDERQITIDELIAQARARLRGFPDCIMTVSQPSLIGGQSSPVEMEIAGDDLDTLDKLALQVQGLARGLPGVKDPDTSVRIGKPKLKIVPRRAVLSDLGMPATALGLALRANIEGLEAGTFKRGDRNYDIVVKFAEEEGKDQVEHFLFPGAPGHPLLLASLGRLKETRAPIQITRKNKRRVSKLFAELDRGAPLGKVVDAINASIDKAGIMPSGYATNFAGEYEVMHEAQVEMGEAMITAIVLVVLTLSAIMESFRQPALILVTIPLGLVGVLYALFLAGLSMDMFVLMGIIMLTGIVVNNAILIMDQFNVHVAEGAPRHKAMVGAACERFRPVAMITLAAVLGMIPLALGQGIGAEMRNGVGVASVGGILVSGILTLIVVPILYDLCTRRAKAPAASRAKAPDTGSGPPGA